MTPGDTGILMDSVIMNFFNIVRILELQGMFVCNVGLGCQYRVGDACKDGDVQFYINDVLDAIEYAIGDQSTTWGAKRIGRRTS